MMNTERRQQTLEGDAELERMRQEYYQMQRMQAEQQRRMEQYQAQLAAAGALDGGTNTAATTTSAEYDRDVYNEYTKMQAGLMSGYCQQVTNHQMGGGHQHQQQQQGGGGINDFQIRILPRLYWIVDYYQSIRGLTCQVVW